MKYLLLIYASEVSAPKPETAAFDKMMQGYRDLAQEKDAKGVMTG